MGKLIVLTGGIGTGKSTVKRMFIALGADTIDADIIARHALQPKLGYLKKIKEHFGPTIINNNGQLKRQQLRNIIFNNSIEKNWIENLLHPYIIHHIKQKAKQTTHYLLAEIPVLTSFTANAKYFDRILVTDCLLKSQIQRVSQRQNVDKKMAKLIISQQLSRKKRLQTAHDVIDTQQDHSKTREHVIKLHKFYMKLICSIST